MFRFLTVPQNHRVVVQDKQGRRQTIDGPRRLLLTSQTATFLEQHTAGPTQYLIVRHLDGRTEHVRGPASLFMDPALHREIDVADATPLDANQAIVVYRQNEVDAEGKSTVSRRVIRGPDLFVPEAREWLHNFSWHGADPTDPTGARKAANVLRFTKLRVIPDQMYLDIENVRTADDALLTVRLMIFFELTDVERMLDRTHDPIADFVNAATADILDFAAPRTFEMLKAGTAKLSEMESFQSLAARAGLIGYTIPKVVFRGYSSSTKLQAMHDGAIEARTQLRLAAETEKQSQALADFKQRREADRATERRQVEAEEAEHKRKLAAAEHEEKLARARAEAEERMRDAQAEADLKLAQAEREHAQKLKQTEAEADRKLAQQEREQAQRLKQAEAEAQAALARRRTEMALRVEARQGANRDRTAYLQSLAALDVDLTRFLIAPHRRPDRTIRIEGTGRTHAPRIHLRDTAITR